MKAWVFATFSYILLRNFPEKMGSIAYEENFLQRFWRRGKVIFRRPYRTSLTRPDLFNQDGPL